ncbi:ribonuclease [Devosia sp.]|uniref:ribonuclease T2 family protein n=1 Tax=Devosia sp. TaxID=1871048 RepID=UPI001AD37D6C|nr:ribonuclease [Devosia sp.]MBN9308235.1 ribonuclease [Devosia sp.]
MNARLSLLLVAALLVGLAVYLWLQPEAPKQPTPAPAETSARGSASRASDQFLILAASWEPAFCETVRNKPECASMGKSRFDASHFSLHGLWPRDEYCGVPTTIEQLDRDGRWQQLPPVDLPADLRKTLAEVMPGTRSQLERHEWTRHGTCYGADAAAYYSAATALLAQLNASRVRDLFAGSIGKPLTQAEIRSAFDDSFGAGAGQRVRVACEDDGSRRIIVEVTVGLWGTVTDSTRMSDLIRAARPTDGGCAGGIIDPVGSQ